MVGKMEVDGFGGGVMVFIFCLGSVFVLFYFLVIMNIFEYWM